MPFALVEPVRRCTRAATCAPGTVNAFVQAASPCNLPPYTYSPAVPHHSLPSFFFPVCLSAYHSDILISIYMATFVVRHFHTHRFLHHFHRSCALFVHSPLPILNCSLPLHILQTILYYCTVSPGLLPFCSAHRFLGSPSHSPPYYFAVYFTVTFALPLYPFRGVTPVHWGYGFYYWPFPRCTTVCTRLLFFWCVPLRSPCTFRSHCRSPVHHLLRVASFFTAAVAFCRHRCDTASHWLVIFVWIRTFF